MDHSGADPGFEKGGGAGGSEASFAAYLGKFKGLLLEIGAKMGGRAPPAPPLWIRACHLTCSNDVPLSQV